MTTRRRPRSSLIEPRRIGLWLESSADDRLQQLADAAGTTKSALTQWLVESIDVDDDGRPVGWVASHPEAQEVLPLDGQA